MNKKFILKGDLHVHTDCSLTLPFSKKPHVLYSPEKAVRKAVAIGLDFLAISDHDAIDGFFKAQKEAEKILRNKGKKIIIIPGEEITTGRQIGKFSLPIFGPHILAYGIEKRIFPFLSIRQTIEAIHEQKGLAVAAHPYCKTPFISLGKNTEGFDLDAIETCNSGVSKDGDQKAKSLAQKLKLPETGGSDAHLLSVIGAGLTLIESKRQIDHWTEILNLIKKGQAKTQPVRRSKVINRLDVLKGLLGVYQRETN